MRVLGLIGMVLALAIVGLLAKKQLSDGAMSASSPAAAAAAAAGGGAAAGAALPPPQLQQQIRQSLDAAMQPRPLPDAE